jgi:antitoxin PrlF
MAGKAAPTRVTRKSQITILTAVRRAAGIEEGDLLVVTVEGNTIALIPKKLVDKSQTYFSSEAWQHGEREATQDIAGGRVRAFSDVDELITAIDAGEA